MIRGALFDLFLLALPFLVYGGWIRYLRRRDREAGRTWNDAPVTWLLISGLVLMLGALFITRLLTGNLRDGVYVPPHYENGQIVPAEIRPPDHRD